MLTFVWLLHGRLVHWKTIVVGSRGQDGGAEPSHLTTACVISWT